MDALLTALACCSIIYLIYLSADLYSGFNKIKPLAQQTPLAPAKLPLVSIIFSALNEEAAIEDTINSFIASGYPHLEVIAVNDRSTDKTPAILNRLSELHPALTVHHVKHLPTGWLGKNHALHFAAQAARGEWLLFTDADVHMKPSALQRALSYAIEQKLDHLTIFENHIRQTFWLRILLLAYYITYSIEKRPWKVSRADTKKAIGHGAFNLVKASAYQKMGGHSRIAMECLDDMKLGELIKANGFKQDTVDGQAFIQRAWYSSLREMITGVQKNSFAHFGYSLKHAARDSFFAVLFFIWPFVSLVTTTGLTRDLNVINILLMLGISAYIAAQYRLEKRYAVFYPLAILILLYSIWNSIVATYKNRGVVWRGTHYSLEMLRNAKSAG